MQIQTRNLYEEEVDPALGNGGRLAACFLDSLATLNYRAFGYGIRYSYGIFKQLIQMVNKLRLQIVGWIEVILGKQKDWMFNIQQNFMEKLQKDMKMVKRNANGNQEQINYIKQYQTIVARAYDTPIPEYMTFNTIALRLWSKFNEGDYFQSLRDKAEYITSVLYPNDSSQAGKELRLKQEYLLVSATLQDILRRFKKVQFITSYQLKEEIGHNYLKKWQYNQMILILLQQLQNYIEFLLIKKI